MAAARGEAIAAPRSKQHRRAGIFDLQLDADGFHLLLNQLFTLLADRIASGGRDGEVRPHAAFAANAVGTDLPTRGIEYLSRFVRVVFTRGQVGREEADD